MEAIFFRFLAAEIGPLLQGRRIEKIFGPAPGVWTFKIQTKGTSLHILFRPAKSAGRIFLSPIKPGNPSNPSAQVMWLRKHLQGRRLLSHHMDWPNLKLAWELSPSKVNDFKFIIFDIKTGVTLHQTLPDSFETSPEWPAFEDILDNDEIWKEYPHISPPLRKHLRTLPQMLGHQEYLQIVGEIPRKFYIQQKEKSLSVPLAWKTKDDDLTFETAIEAANHYGETTLFNQLDTEENHETTTRFKRERKRLRRNQARLAQEEKRLKDFIANKIKAEAMQAELYRFKDMEGLESINVFHPKHGETFVPLNKFLTPTENMERYFRLAAKGERGLRHIERRREQLENELAELDRGVLPHLQAAQSTSIPAPVLPKRYKNIPATLFTSDDGFTIIRGRNKRANHDIISKAASAFDYWFHVADGPSSHVILRRDHPAQDVPKTTLEQAAALCALKSYRKDDTKATVMFAQIKDVRKVKGFAHGQVRVDSVIGTILVDLTQARGLEDDLS